MFTIFRGPIKNIFLLIFYDFQTISYFDRKKRVIFQINKKRFIWSRYNHQTGLRKKEKRGNFVIENFVIIYMSNTIFNFCFIMIILLANLIR